MPEKFSVKLFPEAEKSDSSNISHRGYKKSRPILKETFCGPVPSEAFDHLKLVGYDPVQHRDLLKGKNNGSQSIVHLASHLQLPGLN